MGGVWRRPISEMIEINEKLKNEKVILSPNPIKEKLTISNLSFNYTVQIFNLQGENIYCKNSNGIKNSVEIELSNILSGVYLVKIFDKKNSITKKIIKD